MFTSFLLEKLAHLNQFYKTEAEFTTHLMSGEVKISVPDLIEFQQKYQEMLKDNTIERKLQLPSQFQPNQIIKVKFRNGDDPFTATVRGVHFYPGKVKYDIGLWLGDGSVDNPESETRIYNVDSVFCVLP